MVTEKELADAAVAPRVTENIMQRTIKDKSFLVHGTLTICVLTLQNGFTVIGQSACADAKNFNKDIGERLAYEDAEKRVWPLLGYALRTRLALVDGATRPSQTTMSTYVGTKVVHAVPMTRQAYNDLRGWKLPHDENGDDEGYLVEYADGGEPNHEKFGGYISWSPQRQFEQAYSEPLVPAKPSTFLDRLRVEVTELRLKVVNLAAFMKTSGYIELPAVDRQMLQEQLEAMREYLAIVLRRLRRLDP